MQNVRMGQVYVRWRLGSRTLSSAVMGHVQKEVTVVFRIRCRRSGREEWEACTARGATGGGRVARRTEEGVVGTQAIHEFAIGCTRGAPGGVAGGGALELDELLRVLPTVLPLRARLAL